MTLEPAGPPVDVTVEGPISVDTRTLLRRALDELETFVRIPPQRDGSASPEAMEAITALQRLRATIDDLVQMRDWFLRYATQAILDGGTAEEWHMLGRVLNGAYLTVPHALLTATHKVEKATPPIVLEAEVSPSPAVHSG